MLKCNNKYWTNVKTLLEFKQGSNIYLYILLQNIIFLQITVILTKSLWALKLGKYICTGTRCVLKQDFKYFLSNS